MGHGLLIIDKPTGITSRDAVDCAQKWFPRHTRVGHTGTLDPLATGILVLCIGNATRLTEYVQAMPKTYRAGITFGATSDTDDSDGNLSPLPLGEGPGMKAAAPTRVEIDEALATFVGTIDQVPPAFSAAKVTGRRAYALARKGKPVELEPRKVTIHVIEVNTYEYPRLDITVRCSKGTYIRSLARDLGQRLGCGGYIDALRRLAVGSFTVADALSLETDAGTARSRLLPTWRAFQENPPIELSDVEMQKLSQGQRVAIPADAPLDQTPFAVSDQSGEMLAIVSIIEDQIQPLKVLRER